MDDTKKDKKEQSQIIEEEEKEPSSDEASEGKEEEELEDKEESKEEEVQDDDQEDEEEDEKSPPTHEDIRKSDVLRRDLNQFVRDNQPAYSLNSQSRKFSGKLVTLVLFILAIAAIAGGIYFVAGTGGPKKQDQKATAVPTATLEPTPKPKTLNQSEWSFEVLNGSGVSGEAKRIADALKDLGYQVVKVGNADRDDYSAHEFFVQKDLQEDVNLVVSDIKDIIKIASISGELKDSSASARIIIGK